MTKEVPALEHHGFFGVRRLRWPEKLISAAPPDWRDAGKIISLTTFYGAPAQNVDLNGKVRIPDLWLMARIAAKIAHGFAIAELPPGSFTPYNVDLIIDGNVENFELYVGQFSKRTPDLERNDLGISLLNCDGEILVLVVIQIFTSGIPPYIVIAGRVNSKSEIDLPVNQMSDLSFV